MAMGVYEKLVVANEYWTKEGIARQIKDSASRFHGGVLEPATGIASPSHTGTAMYVAIWSAALVNPDSPSYLDRELLEGLELGVRFLLRSQHEDGTISPPWTNMHSPPDTAFAVGGLVPAYELLAAAAQHWPPLEETKRLLRQFLERTIPAMLTGGCHTPNHRWIMTAALGSLHALTGRPELKRRAEQWLAEGLDCTEDGEWTERSNGIYNAVSDTALVYAAERLGRPELLEPVRRNLRMMAYLLHPDGEVVTDYSGRQDFGAVHRLGGYFLAARWLAAKDRDPLFAALSELAGEAAGGDPGALPGNALLVLLRYPQLRELPVEPGPLPDSYRVILNGGFARECYLSGMAGAGHGGRIYHSRLHTEFGAPVARIRSGMTSATIMTEGSSFFALRHGAVSLLAVQAASAFEPGFVRLQRLERTEDGYRLTASEAKGYYGPLAPEHLPATASGPVSPWYLLPHQLRELTHEQLHHVEAALTETEAGWRIRVRCAGPDALLTQLSFVFDAGSVISGGQLVPPGAVLADGAPADSVEDAAQPGQAPALRQWSGGTVRCAAGADWLELTGGARQHWAWSLNNASYPANCQTLLVNLLAPYDHTFEIRLSGMGSDADDAEHDADGPHEVGRVKNGEDDADGRHEVGGVKNGEDDADGRHEVGGVKNGEDDAGRWHGASEEMDGERVADRRQKATGGREA